MFAFQNKSSDFVKNFIYSGQKLDLSINFGEENKGIPFQCWVEKKTKGEDFEYFYLIIKLDIEGGSEVSITLNHPSYPCGVTTLENMSKNASNFISKYIPKIMEKDCDIIKTFLQTD
tara:strand:- start:5867 stop:6217 length:351 start_codon:yes stop_codon:yes gene_type:complete